MKKTPSLNWDGKKSRPNTKARRPVHIPAHALGNALIAAFVEGGRRFTPGMRRSLGLDASR